MCNSKDKELHVHHKYYLIGKEAWEYPDQAYKTLCNECHSYEEEMLKRGKNNTIDFLRQHGFDSFMIGYLELFFEYTNTEKEVYNYIDCLHQIKGIMDKTGRDFTREINDFYCDSVLKIEYGKEVI